MILSDGQTGVDRATLDVAIKLGIPHGGWRPRGWPGEAWDSYPQIPNCQKRRQLISAFGECLSATFETVDDGQDAVDGKADRFTAINGKQSGTTSCDDIFDKDDAFARLIRAFNKLPRAMLFRLFADHDSAERNAANAGNRDDRAGDRVRAQGHPADEGGHVVGQQVEHPVRDQAGTAGIERYLAAIEVVVRLFARGERKLPQLQSLLTNNFDES